LEISMPADLMQAYADADRVCQVLTDLLDNASRYSGTGGLIQLCAGSEQDRIRIEVIDDGIGISSDDQKNFFLRSASDPRMR
ncbi:MAG: ATP-binding protein, partial [Anaerolineales bacterium]